MRCINSAQRGHHERKRCSGKKAAGVVLTRSLIAAEMLLLPLMWQLLKCIITMRPHKEKFRTHNYRELAFKFYISPSISILSNPSIVKVIM
ncbi:hypothetical protein XELAEV_18027635mg [Xenopus laevis]|uniref:Uncharacterized protein n=1 Tax=Xenopus laevis TaxID=8355 RepID=A0A974HK52_XENLA|nr:hypothetical protein XELAEV_18027635mg [Xenopus laevis]